MSKFELAKLRIDLRKVNPTKIDLTKVDVPKPVYAGAGAAVLAVETLKEYVDTVSKRLTGYRAGVTSRVAVYQKQVVGLEPKALADALQSRTTARVESLTAEAKARRTALESRVGGLQAEAKAVPGLVTSLYKETSSEAREAYDGFAKRGEVIVARLRRGVPGEEVVTVEADEPATTTTSATAKKATAAKKTSAPKAAPKKVAATRAPAAKAPAPKVSTAKASEEAPASAAETPPAETLAAETPAAQGPATEAPTTGDAAVDGSEQA